MLFKRLVLTGFMGSGKTQVGAALATLWGWDFIDTDALVEALSGRRIAELFQEGESSFRQWERQAIATLFAREHLVIATGGGAVADDECRAFLNALGPLVALHAPLDVLWQRAGADANRPLSQDRNHFEALYRTRKPHYERAALHVDTGTLTIEAAAASVSRQLAGSRQQAAGLPQKPGFRQAPDFGHEPDFGSLTAEAPASAVNEHLPSDRPFSDRPPLTTEAGASAVQAPGEAGALVEVALENRSYKIHVAPGGLSVLPELLGEPTACLVVSDEHVAALYGEKVMASLRFGGFQPQLSVVLAGEGSKSFAIAQTLYDACMRMGLKRHQPIIALGGGVVGDLAGFVAATYQRGVPFVQVPTTLLAQIDSSVGGKVAINHPLGKNMIGAFYQPKLVLVDTTTLLTLSEREYRSGLGELVKYGLIQDAALFALLEHECEKIIDRDLPLLGQLVIRCCEIKSRIVARDEREAAGGLRATLNFGHTLGHALEAVAGYGEVLHGEAVATGMVFATRLALALGLVQEEVLTRLIQLLQAFSLPVVLPRALGSEMLLEAMGRDKKNQENGITFILPEALGRVSVVTPSLSKIRATLELMRLGG